LKFKNISQIYEARNWEAEHYNSVSEITVSFLGIHKCELDIYIGFSKALHLQWRHLLRDRRCCTTACPACWAMGKNQVNYVMYGEGKKIFFTGPTREAKAEQKSLVQAQQSQ
jgi:hypothetical protein